MSLCPRLVVGPSFSLSCGGFEGWVGLNVLGGDTRPEPILREESHRGYPFIPSTSTKHLLCARCWCTFHPWTRRRCTLGFIKRLGRGRAQGVSRVPWGIHSPSLNCAEPWIPSIFCASVFTLPNNLREIMPPPPTQAYQHRIQN